MFDEIIGSTSSFLKGETKPNVEITVSNDSLINIGLMVAGTVLISAILRKLIG